jgi:hypothetical protein
MTPILLRGLIVHPENTLRFDFIIDKGQDNASEMEFSEASQRMINYFLASLTIPENDYWVNLSPVEKDRVIPETLIKTELGRDLLSEDYLLKQFTSSLIYPEDALGKGFWDRVYKEANAKFGVTELPVNAFNKVWITPEEATVHEQGDAVYITKSHLKVMLESDYLASSGITGQNAGVSGNNSDINELTKTVLRELVVPAIEKEVNEGKNFARLRQIFHALILAQWYQDVFKESLLNKMYSRQSRVAGIDLSDPANKEKIYAQYIQAYKKGVFNYVKEETGAFSQEPLPRKYFSGGFKAQKVRRSDAEMLNADNVRNVQLVEVRLARGDNAQVESYEKWTSLNRPIELLKELRSFWQDGPFNREGFRGFLEKYSEQVAGHPKYPVQGAWPVLKAITQLEQYQEDDIMSFIQAEFPSGRMKRPALVDAILLMNDVIVGGPDTWLREQAPNLQGKRTFLVSSEIHLWVGGLGPVMQFDLLGLNRLGLKASGVQPHYQTRRDTGDPLGAAFDYSDLDITDIRTIHEYTIDIGDKNGVDRHTVKVRVSEGRDRDGLPVILVRDVQETVAEYQFRSKRLDYSKLKDLLIQFGYLDSKVDALTKDHRVGDKFKEGRTFSEEFKGAVRALLPAYGEQQFIDIADILSSVLDGEGPSFYTRMPYNYAGKGNPAIKEESVAFYNLAVAKLIDLEKPDIVMANDGQLGPLQAVTDSHYTDKTNPDLQNLFWEFRTHTYDAQGIDGVGGKGNRWQEWNINFGENIFLKHMLGISGRYISAAKRLDRDNKPHLDYTSLGVRRAGMQGLATGVSDKQTDEMGSLDDVYADLQAVTNGGVTKLTAAIFLELFSRLFPEGNPLRPLPEQIQAVKLEALAMLNKEKIVTANGRTLGAANAPHNGVVNIKPGALIIAMERRMVDVKMGKPDATAEEALLAAVKEGATFLFLGSHQGTQESNDLDEYFRGLEIKIWKAKQEAPHDWKGDFFFVNAFTPRHKALVNAAKHMGLKASTNHSGAAEVSEEHSAANGALDAGGTFREGVIIDQGVLVDWQHPGEGFIAMPKEDTWQSWLETVYRPAIQLWNSNQVDFYKNSAVAVRMARTMHYLITVAAMLRAMNNEIELKKKEKLADDTALQGILDNLTGNHRAMIPEILVQGRNLEESFRFKVGYRHEAAHAWEAEADTEKGLTRFIKRMRELESIHGFDIFFNHFDDYKNFMLRLLKGTEAERIFSDWVEMIRNEPRTAMYKHQRLENFLESLTTRLEALSAPALSNPEPGTSDDAQSVYGGIDARGIRVNRNTSVTRQVFNDQALEQLLTDASGLTATITGISVIQKLSDIPAFSR